MSLLLLLLSVEMIWEDQVQQMSEELRTQVPLLVTQCQELVNLLSMEVWIPTWTLNWPWHSGSHWKKKELEWHSQEMDRQLKLRVKQLEKKERHSQWRMSRANKLLKEMINRWSRRMKMRKWTKRLYWNKQKCYLCRQMPNSNNSKSRKEISRIF